MALLSRNTGLVGLVLGGAFFLAVGCGDDNKKKIVYPAGDAGESGAGEAGAAATPGGAAGATEPGAAGASEAGAAGAAQGGAAGAPTTSEAGTAGMSEAAGSAGAGALACVPVGIGDVTVFPPEGVPMFCRGALAIIDISVANSDGPFTCCGVSDTATPYTVEISGLATGEGGGEFLFPVPDDASFGTQTLTVNCAAGPVENTIPINVNDGAVAPIVTSVTAEILPNQNLVITGDNLAAVTTVTAIAVDGGAQYGCYIHPTDPEAGVPPQTSLTCDFDDSIAAGDYNLVVYEANCGTAVNSPVFTVDPQPITL